jgi:hypothetical protein
MAVPTKLIFYKVNTQLLKYTLTDNTGTPINNMSIVKANLYNGTGVVCPTFPADLPLTYVAASAGVYQGVIPATFDEPKAGGYTLKVDGTDAAGNKLHEEMPVEVHIRRS